MRTFQKFLFSCGVLAVILLLQPAANACAVCNGGADSTIAPAVNGAILFMIGMVGFMMLSVGGLIFYLARRAKFPQQVSPELAEALNIISEEQQHA